MTSDTGDKPMRRRLSLTKTQRQSEAGAELLSLCQTATEDGSLSDEEIAGLKGWLDANRSSDFPAISYLVATIESILADGRVTEQERNYLYGAVEAILPPELRRDAAGKRKDRERKEAEYEREQAERERQEKNKNRPVGRWNFMVAGVRHENRAAVVRRFVRAEEVAFLIRDRQNRFSRHAVEVRLSNGLQVGYVPEQDAVDMAPLLDQGGLHRAWFTKVLNRGQHPVPVVQALLYQPDAAVEGTVRESQVPRKAQAVLKGPGGGSGCIAILAVLGLLALISCQLV